MSFYKEQLTINVPMVVIIEAKNKNIKAGLAQWAAAILAAQLFNQQEENVIIKIYGAVTTGGIWNFLKLEQNDIFIDLSNYYIKEIDKILGILSQNVQGDIPAWRSTN